MQGPDGEKDHEVDSIVGITNGGNKVKLEMCCQCCSGRLVTFQRDRLLAIANEPLRL